MLLHQWAKKRNSDGNLMSRMSASLLPQSVEHKSNDMPILCLEGAPRVSDRSPSDVIADKDQNLHRRQDLRPTVGQPIGGHDTAFQSRQAQIVSSSLVSLVKSSNGKQPTLSVSSIRNMNLPPVAFASK